MTEQTQTTNRERTYGVAETHGKNAYGTLCHIVKRQNAMDAWALCGISLPFILGVYSETPAGWNLCQKCERIGMGT